MRIRFLDVAQRELDDAVAWYNERDEDLGLDFLDELDRSIRRILSFPLASTEIDKRSDTFESEPCRTRTCDPLVKRHSKIKPPLTSAHKM